MMRRIDLLPAAYAQKRKERRNLTLVIVAGFVAFLLLVGWWLYLGTQISDARDELAQVQAQNAQLQTQIDELQRFADLAAEVQAKETALQTVFAGDIDWPAILTEVAMVVPGEVWLNTLTASAGATEGASPVGTESAPVDISSDSTFGRILFDGNSLSMPGVAKWMIRLESVKEFFAVYLNNATGAVSAGSTAPAVVDFQNTIELGEKAASGRFQNLGQPEEVAP
jgi:Tfp pilus assembly protein PilN